MSIEEVGLAEQSSLEEVEPNSRDVTRAVLDLFEAFPEDFRAQWDAMANLEPDEIVDRLERQYDDEPAERREILIAYIARQLGYSWYLNRASKLKSQPLWDLVHAENFALLEPGDREILWMIACSSQKVRQTLHPKAALAAVALWRHGDGAEHERAAVLISSLGFPTRMHFLYDLVRELARVGAEEEVPSDRRIYALAKLQLDAGLCDVAALMGGLFFVRRFDPWYTGSPKINLENACDRAAQERPFEYRDWIDLMADAAVAGQLGSSWLEEPVKAAIRLSVGDLRRLKVLRAFHDRRLYEASIPRLRRLYKQDLRAIRPARAASGDIGQSEVMHRLAHEIDITSADNPVRALRLCELVATAATGLPLPMFLQTTTQLGPLSERLLALYVECLHLDPVAVAFVRKHRHMVDWNRYPVGPIDVERFLTVGDYEGTFGGRAIDFLGTPLRHLDKDAAARVRYFHTDRADPNSVAMLLRNFALPDNLLVSSVAAGAAMESITDQIYLAIDKAITDVDHRHRVVSDLQRLGAAIETFDDIANLPAARVDAAARRLRHQRLIAGAASGATVGMLAPSTMGLSTVLDVPLLMALVSDTCVRHCWYYGFDPLEHPDLPLTILAVALGGTGAAGEPPEQTRRALQRYLTRRSILLAAVGQGALPQIAGPTVGMLLKRLGHRRSLALRTLERLVRRNRKTPQSRRVTTYVLPAADAILGASFNVSLVYDLGESAQAVLADRFLARKYPDWKATY